MGVTWSVVCIDLLGVDVDPDHYPQDSRAFSVEGQRQDGRGVCG